MGSERPPEYHLRDVMTVRAAIMTAARGGSVQRDARTPTRILHRAESLLTPALVSALVAGCAGGESASEGLEWRTQVDTVGDTVVVRTLSGSEWGAAQLVAEIRIGAVEGADHELFGQITGLAVDAVGSIYVYDAQVPALRKYASDGRYLATLGRKGGGPGEYARSDPGGLAVLSDGRVLLRDPRNLRFTVYSSDGEFLESWRMRTGTYTFTPIVPMADGGFYNPVFPLGKPTRLVRYAADGTPGDSLALPEPRVELQTITAQVEGASQTWAVPFTATSLRAFHPDGYHVSAASNEYAVDLLRREGGVLRLVKDAESVPVTSEERAAEEQRATEAMRRLDPSWSWNGPAIPRTKPILRELYAGEDGRIWVQLRQPGQRVPDAELQPRPGGRPAAPRFREPVVFDVFDKDGRYLGRVTAPARFSTAPRPVFRGDHVWGTETDELGVQYVLRYRIAAERGQP
ncbi:MAG: hypothetical protein JSW71_19770 [Gemmatimonadota bacterium]|nr:MAG: hypothetical protein JSW71_19770 [Gemmatimonadota bacterium]